MGLKKESLVCFLWTAACIAQSQSSLKSSFARGLEEYQAGQFAPAAQDFQQAVQADVSNLYAQFYLGQALFRQRKYEESAGPYEQALELDKAAKKLSQDERRIATDHLATVYSISGDLRKLHTLLDGAIRQDPQYALNYYNLAAAFAREGEKDKMLANLSLALQYKDHVLKGERLPDPRRDDMFSQYAGDRDFIKLIRANGLDENTDPEDE